MNKNGIPIGVRLLVAVFCWQANAQVTVPKVIGDNMVLQCGKPVPIWGWAKPGGRVTVRFAGQQRTSTVDATGRWQVKLQSLKVSSEPAEMMIEGASKIALTNILVGEVWFCSGQSNMEKPIGAQRGQKPVFAFDQELSSASHPEIRLFKAERARASSPAADVKGGWSVCNSNALEATKFSAAGYFFGREIHKELNVPVGLVESTWGGTRIEPWTPQEGFKMFPGLAEFVSDARNTNRPAAASTLYNGMVAPLVPFAIRGALWYQGESNLIDVNDGLSYVEKMKALVLGWRKLWGQGNFPFYYVQIAPYAYTERKDPKPHTAESLPLMWEAQTLSLDLPKTGMIVTTDLVDDLRDIHPRNKQDVGKRLALLALAKDYGRRNLVDSGPFYQRMKIRGSNVVLSFDAVGGGLVSKDGKPLTWFTIAGADGKFEPADAVIEGKTIIVSSPKVPAPKAVRFAWNEAAQPNFFNKDGLPAVPFRTDGPPANHAITAN
jgi:sialate O-acetylesterase